MTDLKARWEALIDSHSGESEQVITSEPVQPKQLSPQQVHWLSLLDSDSYSDESEQPIASEPAQSNSAVLPVYKATHAEINYWHASGCNVFLQTLLREYDLDNSSANVAAYNHFKIGLDEKRHVATFAIDDTHFYAIEFNKWNCAPLNKARARGVLEKISAIRIATSRFENFCGVPIERFD